MRNLDAKQLGKSEQLGFNRILHQFARDTTGKLLPIEALGGTVQIAQFNKVPQVEVAEPISIVLKLIMDNQHKRLVDGRRDIHASASQRRRYAMVQRMPEALIEARRTWSCPLQVDGPDVLGSIQLDVPPLAFGRVWYSML